MKLINEDLRRIILEEVEKVLNEFHDAIDGEGEDEKKQVTTSDMSQKFYNLSKDLKSPEAKADMKQGELTVANEIFDEIMRILRKERDNKAFMLKIKTSIERLVKAEDK
jgi:hypothetical protein